MGEIKKALQKMTRKDALRVKAVIRKVMARDGSLSNKKLTGYEHYYRVRIGNYRIIYYDDGERIVIKAIRKRDETTYSNF